MTDKNLPMPTEGGVYQRLPDGSLQRIDVPDVPSQPAPAHEAHSTEIGSDEGADWHNHLTEH